MDVQQTGTPSSTLASSLVQLLSTDAISTDWKGVKLPLKVVLIMPLKGVSLPGVMTQRFYVAFLQPTQMYNICGSSHFTAPSGNYNLGQLLQHSLECDL